MHQNTLFKAKNLEKGHPSPQWEEDTPHLTPGA